MLENPITYVKSLKGAAISILFALAIVKQNTGAEWLSRVTGYSINPTMEGLLLLKEYGLVVQVDRYHWGLAASAQMLPLMIDESPLPLVPGDGGGTLNNSESRGTASSTAIVGKGANGKAEEAADKRTLKKYESNLKALKEVGIYGKKAESLAKLPHVNPDYIKAHAEKVKDEEKSLGLCIVRMESGDPRPETRHEKNLRLYGQDFG
jgi:hypothetical protein